MELSRIKSIASTLNKARPGLVVLGWGISLASLATTAIFQALVVPQGSPTDVMTLGRVLYYAGIFAVSFLAGFVLEDVGRALVGFFASYGIGILLTYLALYLPALGGLLSERLAEVTGITLTFIALFPFALLVGLIGGLLGAVTSEP